MSRLLILTVASIGAAPAAPAATYTDRSSFEAAVDESFVEDFESYAPTTVTFFGPAVLPSGLTISTEFPQDPFKDVFVVGPGQSTNPTTAFGSNFPLKNNLFFDLGGGVGAFGADIFHNLGGGTQADGPVDYLMVAFLDGIFVESASGSIDPDGGGFLGLTATSPFDAVRLVSTSLPIYEVVDNVTVGDPAPAPIPLPAGLPLLAAALAALAGLRRRSRR